MRTSTRTFVLSDFDFELPPELVAQFPPVNRSASRLLVVPHAPTSDTRASAEQPLRESRSEDRLFAHLPSLLAPGDLVVFNDTRVIRARLFGTKDSGGKVELMIERIIGPHDALAQIRASHPPRAGSAIAIAGVRVDVVGRDDRLFHLRVGDTTIDGLLERHGEIPLPPYIARPADGDDAERYQTVYAKAPGAVAAPTAGLHFDPQMFDALGARGVATAFLTLHVGAGTFLPVKSETLAEHRMHSEWFDLPQATVDSIGAARARGGRIVAVGTTTLRALESAARDGALRAGAQETALFITPGYRFNVVDVLLTNFHLPKSTLLMLVSAFAGYDTIRAAYAHAVAGGYRFFSYGDAMLLERAAG